MRLTLLALLLTAECLCAGSDDLGFVAPAGSSIYVDSNNGFDIFIQAAFQAKHLNVRIVSSADKADYVLDSSLFHSQEFAATQKVAGTYRTS
jgi:hypothetical protein